MSLRIVRENSEIFDVYRRIAQQLLQHESIRVVDLSGAQGVTGATQFVACRKQRQSDPRAHAYARQTARSQPREIECTESQSGGGEHGAAAMSWPGGRTFVCMIGRA